MIKAGINSLDDLRGGGLPPRAIVLFRGGPGSGKTTLGLQIVANLLPRKPERGGAMFLSLENDPHAAIDYANKSVHFNLPRNERTRLALCDRTQADCPITSEGGLMHSPDSGFREIAGGDPAGNRIDDSNERAPARRLPSRHPLIAP